MRPSRAAYFLSNDLQSKASLSNKRQEIANYRLNSHYNDESQGRSNNGVNWKMDALKLGAAAGLTAIAVHYSVDRKCLLAEENTGGEIRPDIMDNENRLN